jgi:SAM-dependent methyltransferase
MHSVAQFDKDTQINQGYLYTTNARQSSKLANKRLTDITQAMTNLRGQNVIDIGCGDDTYTHEFAVSCAPKSMTGVDASVNAITIARQRFVRPGLFFENHDVYHMPFAPASFDIAIVRGLLHHLTNTPKALKEINRIAKEVLVIEPNGYNPILKLIEKYSSYHRLHQEKSYPPYLLRRWIKEQDGVIKSKCYVGLVPFFSPDWMATSLKTFEPIIEALPLARELSCAVYVVQYRVKKYA